MKSHLKWIACGTSALFAATLSLQAQTSSSSQQQPSTSSSAGSSQTTSPSSSPGSTSSASTEEQPSSSTSSATSPSSSSSSTTGAGAPTGRDSSVSDSRDTSSSSSSSAISQPSTSTQSSTSTPSQSTTTTPSSSTSTSSSATGSASGSVSGSVSTTPSTTTGTTATGRTDTLSTQPQSTTGAITTTQTDSNVTTIVQHLDMQGPAVVERISTQFADVTCTPENARKLIEGLTTGSAVTLSADGKTATFTPTTRLGYGESYIALALAAEALRNAGITGCATPDQWQAVLMGGPLAVSGTTSTATTQSSSATSSSSFPGILALRSQGQGWGQIAQTTNVQLGQVISSAQSSFNLDTSSSAAPSPTGRTNLDQSSTSSDTQSPGRSGTAPHGKAYGHDKDKAQGKAKGHDKSDKDEKDDDGSSRSNR